MRKHVLAAAALALAAGLTTGAMAFDDRRDGGHHVEHFRAGASGGMHDHRGSQVSRFAGVRSSGSRRHGGATSYHFGGPSYRGEFIDLGPLGITTACGSYRNRPAYCGPGYSVSAWSW